MPQTAKKRKKENLTRQYEEGNEAVAPYTALSNETGDNVINTAGFFFFLYSCSKLKFIGV